MRRSLAFGLAFASFAVACGSPSKRQGADASPPPRPGGSGYTIVLVTIDTLRADHLGVYGYSRPTSPNIDALAKQGATFTRAFTHWPKTRGSMAAMLTGRRPSQSGYSKHHPGIPGFNPTLASTLKDAGYRTVAFVDNPNVAVVHGYSKGFDAYHETWEDKSLTSEWDRTRAITDGAMRTLAEPRKQPLFLWLHYVNPHAPYTPPPPFDTRFLDGASKAGPRLPVVPGAHGGIPKQWAVAGQDRLGYYVAQYDGEIAAVDQEVGRVVGSLGRPPDRGRTVLLLTSDHGESLGEHGYYFDHGENLFDPSLGVPMILTGPGVPPGERREAFVSTLDVVPTLLDAAKVSYPPDLGGTSFMDVAAGRRNSLRDRLFAQNDRNLSATWTAHHKLVATPGDTANAYALFDRRADPGETRDRSAAEPDALRAERRELELYLERADREWVRLRPRLGDASHAKPSREACERLRALGYLVAECE